MLLAIETRTHGVFHASKLACPPFVRISKDRGPLSLPRRATQPCRTLLAASPWRIRCSQLQCQNPPMQLPDFVSTRPGKHQHCGCCQTGIKHNWQLRNLMIR